MQTTCITNLKKLIRTKSQNLSDSVIRFCCSSMGNIFLNTSHKIIDENNEIFSSAAALLKDLNSNQKLEDFNNTRLLAAILRVLGALNIDFKYLSAGTGDFLIPQIIKYTYLGTSFFPLPTPYFVRQNSASSDNVATSSSEISEGDESAER